MDIVSFLGLLLSISLFTTPAWSQSTNPVVVILSEGNTTCGEFMTQPEMQAVRVAWVLGYISGVNAGLARSADVAPAERMAGKSFQQPATVLGWLQSYCAVHPLDILVSAAAQLRMDFHQT
jgi:hypothetical protein